MKRILIVDDSPTVRQQVAMALRKAGFEIVEAGDGMAGLEAVKTLDIAAVVCDVNMPTMGGLEMVEALRSQGIKPKLPIVMLTTEGQPTMIQRAKAAGAKGWMVKPFKPESLVAVVAKLAA